MLGNIRLLGLSGHQVGRLQSNILHRPVKKSMSSATSWILFLQLVFWSVWTVKSLQNDLIQPTGIEDTEARPYEAGIDQGPTKQFFQVPVYRFSDVWNWIYSHRPWLPHTMQAVIEYLRSSVIRDTRTPYQPDINPNPWNFLRSQAF